MKVAKGKLYINANQAAKYLGRNRQTIINMIARGDLTAHIKPGTIPEKNMWQIDFDSCNEYVDKQHKSMLQ